MGIGMGSEAAATTGIEAIEAIASGGGAGASSSVLVKAGTVVGARLMALASSSAFSGTART